MQNMVRNDRISSFFIHIINSIFLKKEMKFFSIFGNNVYSFLAGAAFGFGARCDRNKALARRTAACKNRKNWKWLMFVEKTNDDNKIDIECENQWGWIINISTAILVCSKFIIESSFYSFFNENIVKRIYLPV